MLGGRYLEVEWADGDATVTGITPEGMEMLIDFIDWLEQDWTIEQICAYVGWDKDAFRIFYTYCNLSGLLDIVERARREIE